MEVGMCDGEMYDGENGENRETFGCDDADGTEEDQTA